ncbi:MAG: hypothetical protein IID31_06785, partial [Planctomycetes bacterium]|nr:hypothetical protein [Planctomycetota bacterium]
LAAHFRDQLDRLPKSRRGEIATRLGRLYVAMLDADPDASRRRRLENLSRTLLEQVPQADSPDLRLSLAKATYLSAERVAERNRLRLVSPADAQEAERTMRSIGALFQDIGSRANRSVEVFERREQSAREEDLRLIRPQLADARRIRSLAMYYAGWSSYYVALLSGVQAHADEALRHFGWLLNSSGGKQASVDRASERLFRFEHVARAAMGAALCEGLKSNAGAAERWLDLLERADELPDAVREQLFPRRLTVLAESRRWADLNWRLDRMRRRSENGVLPVREARLAAVYVLDALGRRGLPERVRPLLEEIARESLSDLVSTGEVSHVLDLAAQFGTAQLGEHGFIVNYVRGLQSFQHARALHADTADPHDEPSSSDAVRIKYREAAGIIAAAIGTEDAQQFAEQLGNARLLQGLSLFYAGEFEDAAALLEAAHAGAPNPAQAEEALWLVVIALDRAVERGRTSLSPELVRLTTLYLQSYPSGERAAKLLLSRAGAMSDERAVEILLGVESDSPLYESARRHAAQLLYRIFRRADVSDRDFAALQFVTIAEQVLALDRRLITSADKDESLEAASRVIGHVRQILDALLRSSGPDLERAQAALQILDGTAAQSGIDLSELQPELAYRRLQIAVHRNDEIRIELLLAELHALGGIFSDNADRLVYDRARRLWRLNEDDVLAATRVVRTGARVALQFDDLAVRRRDVASLLDTVAAAAAMLWDTERDEAMRDIALEFDRRLIENGHKTIAALRRLALLAESIGQTVESLDAWRMLLSGLPVDDDEWFEARYHTIRLLWHSDAPRAAEVMRQFVLLHPDYGPEPWGPLLRELDRTMSDARAGQPKGTPPPPRREDGP